MFSSYSFELSMVGLISSALFRISAAVFYLLVIVKALNEVKVRNGLIKLRRQLLTTAIILFLINTTSLALLIVRPYVTVELYRAFTDALSIFNSVGFFVVAFLLWRIYTQSYTPEQIEFHKQIAEREDAEDRDVL